MLVREALIAWGLIKVENLKHKNAWFACRGTLRYVVVIYRRDRSLGYSNSGITRIFIVIFLEKPVILQHPVQSPDNGFHLYIF